MNILKLQNELKSVPDDALIGYVQNPTGQVPSYLALSELQRRKEMRASYQAQQPSSTTVADDVAVPTPAPQAMPEPQAQGVAGLPVPDQMFSGQGMAAGGIVAFDDGGEVKHYKKGDYVLSSDYDPEAYGTSYREGLAGLESKYPVYSATDPYGNVRKKAIREYRSSTKTPYDDAIKYYEEQGLGYKGKLNAVPGTTPVRKLENARDEWLASQGTMPTAPVTKPSNEPDVRLTGDANQNAAKQPFQGVGFDGSFYDKMLKKEKTLQELSDEYKAVLGTDPTLAGRQEKLAKMEARAKRMEDMAPGMAMLEAGLGIAAGTSPFALANIGKGAMAGVKSYGDAQNKLADLEEKRFSLDTELAKQQRAEQMAAITFGDRSRQHTEEMNKTVMLTKAKDKLTRDMGNLEASTNLITKTAANAPKIDKIAEARAAYQGSKAQNEVKKALLKQYGDNAANPKSDRNAEFLRDLRVAEEQYLANYFAPIGSNIPTLSTDGFKIKK
jgi:hypothetical protein